MAYFQDYIIDFDGKKKQKAKHEICNIRLTQKSYSQLQKKKNNCTHTQLNFLGQLSERAQKKVMHGHRRFKQLNIWHILRGKTVEVWKQFFKCRYIISKEKKLNEFVTVNKFNKKQ